MTKKELRKIYLEKRRALSEAEFFQRNHHLCEQFFAAIDLSFVKVLHIFIPIEKNREPNTWLIIDRIRREFPQIRLSIPRVNQEESTLENFFFEGLHQLKLNTWGIPEPKQGVPTPLDKIDMVLIPLVAFDLAGHRVGYGKGFYDRLLAGCRPDCQRIGLSLFNAVEAIDDIQSHDKSLHQAVTPSEVVRF
jgi:5-formyltetrahydrofolate cyclo-ligase